MATSREQVMEALVAGLKSWGLSVAVHPEGDMVLTHRWDGFSVRLGRHELEDAWRESLDRPEALVNLARDRLKAARAAEAEKERAKKLAATGDNERRRVAFYKAEVEAREKDRTYKPEEPNVRVYGRAVMAVFEVAQRGLSAQEFKALVGIVEEFTRDMVKEGGK